MTNNVADFPEFAFSYSQAAMKQVRDLDPALRLAFLEIVDALAMDPAQNASRTIPISENVFIYRHPEPRLEVTYELNLAKKVVFILHVAAPKLEVPKRIILSYSYADERWARELMTVLEPLLQRDLIEIWTDSKIEAGVDWRGTIEDALRSAKAAIVLVSPNYLNSSFISEVELPDLLERAASGGLRVFWIPVSSSPFRNTEIAKYQALSDPDKPLDSLTPAERGEVFLRAYERTVAAVAT